MNEVKSKKVVVAMSGGVDSSVAAYLLKEKGYEVIGISLQLYDQTCYTGKDFGTCCSISDIKDARRVASKLGIPFYVANFEKEFREEVIEHFLDEYFSGRTPNPCILCNRKIKFKYLLKRAMEIGASYLATGHYAQIVKDEKNGEYLLKKGVDKNKDQSYFLAGIGQDILQKLIFPVGNLKKNEVREIAKKGKLPVWEKRESQEICFVPSNNYREFLKKERPHSTGKAGNIVTSDGKVISTHKGIENYTIGQRRGLGIAAGKPLYVIRINTKKNEIVVGSKEELYKRELVVRNLIWHSKKDIPNKGDKVEIKYRYRSSSAPAEIVSLSKDKLNARFTTPQKSLTPGQEAVFYRGDMVLGAGTIEEAK
ncbi:MAG: tRNA 2-thiouridine(34) synthase MnmA [Candidatus Schekmanbacteria bacterium]|nr:MAG: tRNA 2-thiouridine(34) synthase MnmA [Candidatus Schekmanbacteria bacterium]